MTKQTTNTILMIEPVAFGYNRQTAVNNYFQQKDNMNGWETQSQALEEFNRMVKMLRYKGVNVLVVKDTLEPHTPDSIFPNNWISFHEDGRVALYPMYAENRRAERRSEILQYVVDHGFKMLDIVDYTLWEYRECFLEGTGSLILDHSNKIAYASLSDRTNENLVLQFCSDFSYEALCFSANQTVDGKRLPVYHTNVMMCVGEQFAVVCLDCLDSVKEYNALVDSLAIAGKEIISISEEQMLCFAGNMLQVENNEGKYFLVLSKTAYDSLTMYQIHRLSVYNELIIVEIPTIEKLGGGSARCMMAEVFL